LKGTYTPSSTWASLPHSKQCEIIDGEKVFDKTGDRRQETEDRRQEIGDRRQKTGDRRQETEDRRQKTGDRR
jgi:hypothetical protein